MDEKKAKYAVFRHKGRKYPLLAHQVGVEVVARPPGRCRQPARVYIIRAFLEGSDLKATAGKGCDQSNGKGSLPGPSPKSGNDYPWY